MRRAAFVLTVPVLATLAPIAAPSADEAARSPQEIYQSRCAYCHDAGGWGTRVLARRMEEDQAELLQRKNLPPAYTMLVVRRGIGAMPQFTPTELTDDELMALANWLENMN